MTNNSNTYTIPGVRICLAREAGAELAYTPTTDPEGAAKLALETAPDDGREHFRLILLDVRRKPIALHTVSVGCLTASLVHPREVFRPAILAGAASIILTHNHPSGDVEPSAEDLSLTRRLHSAGELVGIEIVDHVITGDGSGRWVSLKSRGIL